MNIDYVSWTVRRDETGMGCERVMKRGRRRTRNNDRNKRTTLSGSLLQRACRIEGASIGAAALPALQLPAGRGAGEKEQHLIPTVVQGRTKEFPLPACPILIHCNCNHEESSRATAASSASLRRRRLFWAALSFSRHRLTQLSTTHYL